MAIQRLRLALMPSRSPAQDRKFFFVISPVDIPRAQDGYIRRLHTSRLSLKISDFSYTRPLTTCELNLVDTPSLVSAGVAFKSHEKADCTMATNQPAISNAEAARRSQSPMSHGRGGAGNINSKPSAPVAANDLQTPTLKSSTYTTGRGGEITIYQMPFLLANTDPRLWQHGRQLQRRRSP